MTICPHCFAHFETRTIRDNEGGADHGHDHETESRQRLTEIMAGYEAVATGKTEGVTRQDLFEAAVGTLSRVAKEVPELQAAKIRSAINVLLSQ